MQSSKKKNFFRGMLDIFSRMLFPKGITCISCGGELDGREKGELCENCSIEYNKHFCVRCGRSIKNMAKFCDRCIAHGTYYFDMARSAVSYNETAKRLIHNFKYSQAKYLTEPLVIEMVKCAFREKMSGNNIDCIAFVPLHSKRKRERGYNQAELLAKGVSNRLRVPYKELLIKSVHTDNLAKLNRKERIEIIKNTFEVIGFANNSRKQLKGKTILLIDDVLTTTATANECARMLKKAGAKTVFVLTYTSVEIKPLD